ncbi:MAG: phage major capsid protein [Actinomycetota bacterium]
MPTPIEDRAHHGSRGERGVAEVRAANQNTMLDMVRSQLSEAIAERETLRSQFAELDAAVAARNGEPTSEQLNQARGIRSQIAEIDARLDGDGGDNPGLRAREIELLEHLASSNRADAMIAGAGVAGSSAAVRSLNGVVGVGGEPHVYQDPRTAHSPADVRSWAADMLAAEEHGDAGARERLARNAAQIRDENRQLPVEQRAWDTGDMGSATVPPAYLNSLFIHNVRRRLVTAELVNQAVIPDRGMKLSLPKFSTSLSVGVQAAEGDAPTDSDGATTDLEIDVRTLTGKTTLSRQAVERADADIDRLVIGELSKAYGQLLNDQVLTGTGATGQLKGLLTVTPSTTISYTDASPTAGELYPKIGQLLSGIVDAHLEGATEIVMSPRRWNWLASEVDADGRPLFVPGISGPNNALGVMTGRDANRPTPVGQIMGLPVYVDPSIPTNLGAGTDEDVILAGLLEESTLWTDRGNAALPRAFKFDQLTVEDITFAVMGYVGFTAERHPTALGKLTGTGLVTPTF